MNRFLLAVLLTGTTARAEVNERQVLDAFVYANDTAARAAWTPVENSAPVQAPQAVAGRRGLRLPCDMTGARRRAAWDKSVNLDLTRADRIAFWFYVDEPAALASHFTFYCGSGGGWFGASFAAERGWQRVVLDKAAFRSEGTPTGWNSVQTLRISAWKSVDARSFIAIADLEALSSPVVVVLGTASFANEGEEKTVRSQAQIMTRMLERLGLESGALGDSDVENGALRGRRVAILPYNPRLSENEIAALEAFIAGGGKVLAFYQAPPRLLAAIGLRGTGWQRQAFDGQFDTIRLQPGIIEGLPESVKQRSWNITKVAPDGKNARLLGEWLDNQGRATGLPALAVSDSGAFMTHVLLADDPDGKAQLMLALLGRFVPEIWEQAAARAFNEGERVGEFESFDSAAAFIAKAAKPAATAQLDNARRLRETARTAIAQKQFAASLPAARTARQALAAAYAAAQPSQAKEIRAVWCHAADGVSGMTWDASMKALAANGFNMVVPNMLWGGLAYYPSEVLPVSDEVAAKGDQIAACVAASKKYGVQVHVWKVNWSLNRAPADFVAKMRATGRTQKDTQGKDLDWLCPSHPDNFALEHDSMLEVARRYDVDGLHFDYIRYPGPEGCYCDGCRVRFEKEFGVTAAQWPGDATKGALRPQFLEFRRGNITRLVKAVSEAAHKLKPNIKISAAVFRDWPQCRDTVGQDWANWVKLGYLDFVCPMNYTDKPGQFETWIKTQLEATGHAVPLVSGVGVTLDDWTLTSDQTIRQINATRRQNADGFILFNYTPYVASDVLPALHSGITAAPAMLP